MTALDSSIFRRRVIAQANGHSVIAGIEDDFHHYEIMLGHDGVAITSVEARSLRTPWLTCNEAEGQLDRLVGHPIGTRPTGLPDPHFQCTHMFELAIVAMAQAARRGIRTYEVSVPLRQLNGPGSAQLYRDDELLFDWRFQGDILTVAGPFTGRNLRTLVREAEANVETDDETLEAIRVLRRSIHVSSGRSVPFENYHSAADIKHVRGACYVFQPVRVDRALRNPGSRRDFSRDAGAPLRDFPDPQGCN